MQTIKFARVRAVATPPIRPKAYPAYTTRHLNRRREVMTVWRSVVGLDVFTGHPASHQWGRSCIRSGSAVAR
jgi:hypothetical protein